MVELWARTLGPDDPVTVATRDEIALIRATGGDVGEALRLYRELLADDERVLGPDHSDTFGARHNIAYFTGATGDATEALRLYREALEARKWALGPDQPA